MSHDPCCVCGKDLNLEDEVLMLNMSLRKGNVTNGHYTKLGNRYKICSEPQCHVSLLERLLEETKQKTAKKNDDEAAVTDEEPGCCCDRLDCPDCSHDDD